MNNALDNPLSESSVHDDDEEEEEEDVDVSALIQASLKTMDSIVSNNKNTPLPKPKDDLSTQPLMDQIGHMQQQLRSELSNQLSSSPPLQTNAELFSSLPFDSDSDDDAEDVSLSYDEWKEQQQLKRKQHVLEKTLKPSLSPTSLFDRLTTPTPQSTTPLFKPQMTDDEHLRFLSWMFPLAS